ncbi:MAG TPA: hypothetical protein PKE69_02715 [Pyrinomonadaceae bacterium]|nr:hypothetical protein [Pyrinomonadaceae bacterium]
MINKNELFDDVLGGREIPKDFLRDDIVESNHLIVSSALDKRMVRSVILHPKLKVKFRNNDLASLGEPTKKSFVEDIEYVLGIKPLSEK